MKNLSNPGLSRVIPWTEFLELEFEDEKDLEFGKVCYYRAQDYIKSYSWCSRIDESYVGICQAEIIGLFLFKINLQKEVGDWFWVFVGDIPPVILPVAVGRNPGMALDVYFREMSEWVDAVDEGRPVNDLIPVNAPPTKEYADMLRGRLGLIGEHILMGELKDDLDYDPNAES
jgi:hypothetical protein